MKTGKSVQKKTKKQVSFVPWAGTVLFSVFCSLSFLHCSSAPPVPPPALPPQAEKSLEKPLEEKKPRVVIKLPPHLVRFNNGVTLLDGALRLSKPLKDAEEEFEAALSLSPGFQEALFNLAYISYMDAKYEDALRNIEAALSYGKTKQGEILKASILEKRGDSERAIKEFLSVAKRYSNAQFAFGYAGTILMGQNKYKEALHYFEKTGRLDKEKYQVFTNKGTCYLNLGLYKEASESFGAVYRLGVRERYLLSQYAFSLRKKGDIKQALLVYKELIGLFPDETSAYKNAGIIYDLYMNLPREAIGYYKEYIERGGPDSVNVKNWRQVAMDKTKGWFE